MKYFLSPWPGDAPIFVMDGYFCPMIHITLGYLSSGVVLPAPAFSFIGFLSGVRIVFADTAQRLVHATMSGCNDSMCVCVYKIIYRPLIGLK